MGKFQFAGPQEPAAVDDAPKPNRFKGPDKKAAVSNGPLEDAGLFLLDILRNFNDTASFGLYNKALEATGVDPLADEKLMDSNPIAGIIGDMGGYSIPGAGFSKAASMVPGLAKNSIASTGGTLAASRTSTLLASPTFW